jgi:hypothetical protein
VGLTAGLDAMEKRRNVSPAGNRTPAAQPLARRYTDCTIPTPIYLCSRVVMFLMYHIRVYFSPFFP